MNIARVNEILGNKEKCDVFYEDKLVWIQEISNGVAKVGFIDGAGDMDVLDEDLHEWYFSIILNGNLFIGISVNKQ